MEIMIVTGMSGAGKSTALNVFEDLGYYCIDNMPPQLIINFVNLVRNSNQKINKLALVLDIRGRDFFSSLDSTINKLREVDVELSILFLECKTDVLVKRYKEMRRPHPLDKDSVIKGIEMERKLLSDIKPSADRIIDTSDLRMWDLRSILLGLYSKDEDSDRMTISLISFGFKYGIPIDSDLVIDVRFLPNPYYIDELKDHTGMDRDVRDYVFSFDETNIFIEKFMDLLTFLIPYYKKELKNNLVISIGCTGGKHRSIAITEEVANRLDDRGEIVLIRHRDEDKNS